MSQSIEVNYTAQTVTIGEKQIPLVTSECKNNGLYETKHDDLEELGTEWNKTEYRFGGANPNNYVSFNNEIWRIIGLVNVKVGESVEQRIKIIRTNGVAGQNDYAKNSNGNIENFDARIWNSNYSNNWLNAKIKSVLNTTYYESIISESQNMIDDDVIWNLGGWDISEITSKVIYEKERGTNVYAERPFEWSKSNDFDEYKGLAIIYPSDYGYAVGGEARNNCLNTTLYGYGFLESGKCNKNNWILYRNNQQWLLFPNYTEKDILFSLDGVGYVKDHERSTSGLEVAPTLYLKSTVTISSGEGTIDSPYELQL